MVKTQSLLSHKYRINCLHSHDSFLSHGWSRIITGFSLCPELSNSRIFLFHSESHGFSLSRIIELSNFSFSHGVSRIFFFIPNYRIIEFFFSHGMSRIITDIYFLSRIIELSNFFSHGVPRRITDLFFCHEFANSKIRDKEKHP